MAEKNSEHVPGPPSETTETTSTKTLPLSLLEAGCASAEPSQQPATSAWPAGPPLRLLLLPRLVHVGQGRLQVARPGVVPPHVLLLPTPCRAGEGGVRASLQARAFLLVMLLVMLLLP